MIQCCLNVGPPSPSRPHIKTTLGQRLVFAGSASVINSRPIKTATLTKCWASVVDGVPALKQRWLHVIVQRYACLPVWSVCPRGIGLHNNTQLTQEDVESMLDQRLSTIYDVGPTLIQRLVSAGLPSFIDDALTLNQQKKTIHL